MDEGAIGLEQDASSVLLAVLKQTLVPESIVVVVDAVSRPHVVNERTLIAITAGPREDSHPVPLVCLPVALVLVAVGEEDGALAVSEAADELAVVLISVLVIVRTGAVSHATEKLSHVAVPSVVEIASSLAGVVLKEPLVGFAVGPDEESDATTSVVHEVTHVAIATHPGELPEAILAIIRISPHVPVAADPSESPDSLLLVVDEVALVNRPIEVGHLPATVTSSRRCVHFALVRALEGYHQHHMVQYSRCSRYLNIVLMVVMIVDFIVVVVVIDEIHSVSVVLHAEKRRRGIGRRRGRERSNCCFSLS